MKFFHVGLIQILGKIFFKWKADKFCTKIRKNKILNCLLTSPHRPIHSTKTLPTPSPSTYHLLMWPTRLPPTLIRHPPQLETILSLTLIWDLADMYTRRKTLSDRWPNFNLKFDLESWPNLQIDPKIDTKLNNLRLEIWLSSCYCQGRALVGIESGLVLESWSWG